MNPWQQLNQLLAGDPPYVARVLGFNANGQSILESVDSGQQSLANGTKIPAGKLVYVQNGAILSEAPVLAVYQVEV